MNILSITERHRKASQTLEHHAHSSIVPGGHLRQQKSPQTHNNLKHVALRLCKGHMVTVRKPKQESATISSDLSWGHVH